MEDLVVRNLLLLYVVVLLFSATLSGVLWWRHKSALQKSLTTVWIAMFIAAAAQGITGDANDFVVAGGFSTTFLVNVALLNLIGRLFAWRFRWRIYCAVFGVGFLLSAAASAFSAPFWLVSLPMAIGVAYPVLHGGVEIVVRLRDQLSITTSALIFSCLAFGAHNLDFAFLRDKPEMAPLGFTIAVVIVFALSMTGSAVVLERGALERSKMAELDRMKSQFFANVSHELRTPLTVILASVEHLMLHPGLPPEEIRQLEIVRRNAVRLLRLLDEMLALSKIGSGGLRLNVTPFSLRSLTSTICENNHPLAQAKSIDLAMSFAGDEIEDLYGDPHRLEMVIANLLGNALKYTPSGGRVRISVRDDGDGAVMEVEDDGPGIPASDLGKVFERFYQVLHKGRRQGGVGIGLALAKELAEMHGGSLTVRSEVGKGSTFTLRLPKGRDHFRPELIERRSTFTPVAEGRRKDDVPLEVPQIIAPLEESVSLDLEFHGRRPRVLVVEDQHELRAFMVRIFSISFDVIQASDGDEGWKLLQKERPDLVVSDVMMPNRLGTDLCRAIKSDPALRTTPVILLTARVGSEATLEAYAHGADDFVAKPFHPQVLIARVRAQLQIRALSLQVASQEKLAAIGTLAAGVAHEVRNPLNFILNASNVLLTDTTDPETMRELLSVVADGAKRIDGIVSALTTHARPADSGTQPEPCDLREGLEATLRLLQHRMKHVELSRDYQTEQKAWAPPGPVHQVLMNLLDNAVRSGASKISVRLLSAQDRIRVRIADNGPGVPEHVADRIFDPFFTTRPPGEGTGLGLYLSRKIANDCGGSLTLERRSGGAEFQLDLPRVNA